MLEAGIVTKKQLFIDALLDGSGVVEAARIAGYNPAHASRAFVSVSQDPRLLSRARFLMRGKLDLEGAPAGYNVLMMLLRAEDTPKALKVDIAKFLVNHSVAPPKAREEGADEAKEPNQMTDAELQENIDKIDAELVKRGILIDATPSNPIESII